MKLKFQLKTWLDFVLLLHDLPPKSKQPNYTHRAFLISDTAMGSLLKNTQFICTAHFLFGPSGGSFAFFFCPGS